MSTTSPIFPRPGGPASSGSFGGDQAAPQTLQLRCKAVKASALWVGTKKGPHGTIGRSGLNWLNPEKMVNSGDFMGFRADCWELSWCRQLQYVCCMVLITTVRRGCKPTFTSRLGAPHCNQVFLPAEAGYADVVFLTQSQPVNNNNTPQKQNGQCTGYCHWIEVFDIF